MQPTEVCQVPPPGWWCSRKPGHEGPCAARRMAGARKERLEKLLTDHRYKSSVSGQMRGLMPHHIAALTADLLPFIEDDIEAEL